MNFSITPIGVNDAFCREGLETNYLVETAETRFLIDCGTTAHRGLHHLGKELIDIDTVFVSHLHLDHVGGLPQLGLQRFLASRPRPKVFVHESLYPTIWNNFLIGLLGVYADTKGQAQEASIETFFEFIPIPHSIAERNDPYCIEGLECHLIPVQHGPGLSVHGLVLDSRVLVTTDTKFLPDMLENLSNQFGLEAIFHDCTFDERKRVIHATYDELLSLPDDLRELLVLTHYEEDILKDIQDGDALKILLGEAGKKYIFRN